MAQSFIELFKAAFRVSTSLLGVETPDPAAAMKQIVDAYANSEEVPAFVAHDVVRGLQALNPKGEDVASAVLGGNDPASLANPIDMLVKAQELPRKTILFMLGADGWFDDKVYVQAVSNLRDPFKKPRRALVLVGPRLSLPLSLQHDVILFEQPYPDRAELEEIVLRAHADAKLALPNKDTTLKAVDALSGLPHYTAEQVTFMSVHKDEGLVIEEVRERRRKEIEKQKGVSIWRGKETFDSIKGMDNLTRFGRLMKKSKRRAGVVLFLDEIEKMFADVNGINPTMPELLGMFLTWFNDEDCVGLLLLGPGGTGKSLFAKALGNELDVPTLAANFAAMQAGIVGESGDNLMAFLRKAKAVAAGNRIVVAATCNKVVSLPPELKRRFKRGTWFIDIPDAAGLKAGVEYYIKKYSLKDQKMPDMTGWTLAEVEACCEQADDYGIKMVESAETIVPITQSDPQSVEELRQLAHNRFISASKVGKYQKPPKQATGQSREV